MSTSRLLNRLDAIVVRLLATKPKTYQQIDTQDTLRHLTRVLDGVEMPNDRTFDCPAWHGSRLIRRWYTLANNY